MAWQADWPSAEQFLEAAAEIWAGKPMLDLQKFQPEEVDLVKQSVSNCTLVERSACGKVLMFSTGIKVPPGADYVRYHGSIFQTAISAMSQPQPLTGLLAVGWNHTGAKVGIYFSELLWGGMQYQSADARGFSVLFVLRAETGLKLSSKCNKVQRNCENHAIVALFVCKLPLDVGYVHAVPYMSLDHPVLALPVTDSYKQYCLDARQKAYERSLGFVQVVLEPRVIREPEPLQPVSAPKVFSPRMIEDIESVATKLGIDATGTVVGVLTKLDFFSTSGANLFDDPGEFQVEMTKVVGWQADGTHVRLSNVTKSALV